MSDRTYAKVKAQQKTLTGPSAKSSILQRKCACGQYTIAGAECSTCRGEQSTLHRSQRAFKPPSASVAVPGSSPAQENIPSLNDVIDRASRFGHDFSRIPIHSTQAAVPQAKLEIGLPGDVYEQEADQAADTKKASVESSKVKVQGERTFEFNLNDLNSAPRVSNSVAISEKSVEDSEQNFIDDILVERAPAEKGGGGAAPATPAPVAPAKVKKAGVDSFVVGWEKWEKAGEKAGTAKAKLKLIFTAKFKNDAEHDPALAEFRQKASHTFECTAGPDKGQKDTRPLHDDNYSRADDIGGQTIDDLYFTAMDYPGYKEDLDNDDVIDYSFTAEQTIIDTSQSQANKVIAKRGPHTATIKGKHPRTYKGVPKILS